MEVEEKDEVIGGNVNHPIFFGRWLLKETTPEFDSRGFLGHKYVPGMFDELPITKEPDDIYTTKQIYAIFCSLHTTKKQKHE